MQGPPRRAVLELLLRVVNEILYIYLIFDI